jgi:hypothetical protein
MVERLHDVLGHGQAAALTPVLGGQGGIGKTQVAVLYAHEKAADCPGGVFLINAIDPATIVRQLAVHATGAPSLSLARAPGVGASTATARSAIG